ncbi:hypothetical protein [Labilibacter marinus]|uniref:hypothetical protein n=1 Tax=Labilibacter marinus TaxID=1477105 RepID=UPI00082F8003|nr:hypothetical protein [Labilibacter marinus]
MEETKKLYSQTSIAIATYFGGPAAAGYLVKKNYESFSQEDSGKKAFLIGIFSTLLIFAGLFSLPEHIVDKVPNVVIPAIYTGIIYLIVERLQGQWLKEHKESEGKFQSGWKAAGIGVIFMVIVFAVIMLVAFISGDLSNQDFDAKVYDAGIEEFSKNENQSLKVFSIVDNEEPQTLIKELNKGIVLWEENRTIITNLNTIENLPVELLEQNKILLNYCELRIEHYDLIVRALTEETDKYAVEIEKLGVEINQIIDNL